MPMDLLPGMQLLLNPNAPLSWKSPSPNQNLLPPKIQPFDSTSPSPQFIPSSPPIIPVNLFPFDQADLLPPAQSTPDAIPLNQPPVNQPAVNPPPLRHSHSLAALSQPSATALLTEFAKVSHSHELLPLSIEDSTLSPDYVLSTIADSSLEPAIDTGDDPLWADALASPNREYWITGAKDEIQSLKDLQVYVLIPRSSLPSGRRLMRGKLVCKRK
jgi:hypothetical protein